MSSIRTPERWPEYAAAWRAHATAKDWTVIGCVPACADADLLAPIAKASDAHWDFQAICMCLACQIWECAVYDDVPAFAPRTKEVCE